MQKELLLRKKEKTQKGQSLKKGKRSFQQRAALKKEPLKNRWNPNKIGQPLKKIKGPKKGTSPTKKSPSKTTERRPQRSSSPKRAPGEKKIKELALGLFPIIDLSGRQ